MAGIGINTNVEALGAVRYLSKTSDMIGTSMQRLSSGKRVNTAADDAAGLAIISNLNRQITGTEQAIRNANEGISLIQVMDSALEEMTGIFQRARQLAIYSANGTLSATDRASLDAEYQQLVSGTGEADRIVTSTTFNGNSLLDGTFDIPGLDFQVGWQATDIITLNTSDMSLGTIFAAPGDVLSQPNATTAIGGLDTALDAIVGYRAELGAYQNRFSSTISNLENLSEKTQVARGRIEDADFAAESTNLARAQVLQQAGMGMLARANSSSQQVMQLLQQ
ncbi:flagellin N-terminal helical domain-containing protein [Alteromonas macleodii]|uniref:flagellin N-terminal helical domain-containing protein n=1 Tax=Alteromonas macleodii TaxID=28108 RepID=UPI00313FF528